MRFIAFLCYHELIVNAQEQQYPYTFKIWFYDIQINQNKNNFKNFVYSNQIEKKLKDKKKILKNIIFSVSLIKKKLPGTICLYTSLVTLLYSYTLLQ